MELVARAARRLPDKLSAVIPFKLAPYVLRALYDYCLDNPRLPAAQRRRLVRERGELEATLSAIKASGLGEVSRRRRGPAPADPLEVATRRAIAAEFARRSKGLLKDERTEIWKKIGAERGYPWKKVRHQVSPLLRST